MYTAVTSTGSISAQEIAMPPYDYTNKGRNKCLIFSICSALNADYLHLPDCQQRIFFGSAGLKPFN